MTLRPLKTWYEKMLPRERFMLIAFLGVMVLIWLLAFMNQVKAIRTDVTTTKAKVADQDDWLGKQDDINKKLDDLTIKFQHSYNANQLFNMVQQLLQDDKELPTSAYTVVQEATHKSKIFNINTVTVRLKAVPWRNLIDFTQKIRMQAPYFSFDSFSVAAEPTNPTIYTAVMRINSLQLISDAVNSSATSTPAPKK